MIFIALFTVVGSAIACPDRCSCNTTTTTVECVAGNLTVVPPDVPENTTTLNLADNKLTTLTNESFSSLEELRLLNLRNNSISEISNDTFKNPTSLQTLLLNDNSLTSLSGYLGPGLANLTKLNVSGNSIQSIGSNDLAGLSSLQVLDLSANNISSIESDAFAALKNLKTLVLQDNLLETLDDWVKSLSTSANVTLSGNPFKCSCDLINATAKLTSVDETGITCKVPGNDTFVELSKVDGMFNCSTKSNTNETSPPTPTPSSGGGTAAPSGGETSTSATNSSTAPPVATVSAAHQTTNSSNASTTSHPTAAANKSTATTPTQAPSRQEVVKGKNCTMSCNISTTDTSITWTKDDSKIDSSAKQYVLVEKNLTVIAVGKPDAGKYCCATAGNKAYCVMLVVKMPPAPAAKTSPAIYVAVVVLVVFVVAVIGFCVYKRYKSRSTERYGLLNDPHAYRSTDDSAFRASSDDYL